MSNATLITETARRTLRIERDTLSALEASVDDAFVAVVEAVFNSGGRLIVTGIGKTALVAQKIVATLNSTGTPALFLHAADAIHGDIGMVQPNDLVLCISKSGETAEIKLIALLVRQLGNPVVAMVGRPDCSLARKSDHVLLTPISREADPNDLAPTASTTAQIALGDALAMSLLALRGFGAEDFARFHPGGSLGKQLYLRVADLHPEAHRPAVRPATPLAATLVEMTTHRIGATAVLDDADNLLGIITDGDLRRHLSGAADLSTLTAGELMTTDPKTIAADALAVQAMGRLRKYSIQQLLVTDTAGAYLGFLHLHELLREGLV